MKSRQGNFEPLNAQVQGFLERLKARASAASPVDEDPHACPCSRTSGYLEFVDEHGHTRMKRCDCQKRTFAAGVPVPFRNARLDAMHVDGSNRVAHDQARKFLAGERDLYLFGGVGGGKTHTACATLNEYASRCGRGLFVRVPDALHRLEPTVLDEEQRREFERRLIEEPLLVLDDLGAERTAASDFVRRTVLWIYESRGDHGHRTIITSNLTLGQLSEQQGDDRLASRIAGRCDVVQVGGADRRVVRNLRAVQR